MSYRDELDAAKARIRELEGENGRLKEQKAPDRAAQHKQRIWFVFAGLCVVVLVALAAWLLPQAGSNAAADAVRERQRELRVLQEDIADAAASRETLSETNGRLRGEVEERRAELERLTAQVTEAEAHLRSVTAASAPVPAPDERPRRLTEAQIAARLARCETGGSAEYPYAEGVVVRREDEWRRSGVVQRITVRVPGREDAVFSLDPQEIDMTSTTVDSLILIGFREYRFWSRVEVGDILGITWQVRAGRASVFAVRTTDK